MRKVAFGVANSLDNFIARSDHSVDWLLWSDEVGQFVSEFFKSIDTIVMGRKTYEAGAKAGSTSYPGMKTYVISRTMTAPPDPAVEIVGEDGAEFVRRLKAEDGKTICIMGGGELAQSLFEADLIDEIGVNVHPILLGSGIPLFLPLSHAVHLELFENRRFANGCVLLQYRVKR
jgi:dihydrofolate reductase